MSIPPPNYPQEPLRPIVVAPNYADRPLLIKHTKSTRRRRRWSKGRVSLLVLAFLLVMTGGGLAVVISKTKMQPVVSVPIPLPVEASTPVEAVPETSMALIETPASVPIETLTPVPIEAFDSPRHVAPSLVETIQSASTAPVAVVPPIEPKIRKVRVLPAFPRTDPPPLDAVDLPPLTPDQLSEVPAFSRKSTDSTASVIAKPAVDITKSEKEENVCKAYTKVTGTHREKGIACRIDGTWQIITSLPEERVPAPTP